MQIVVGAEEKSTIYVHENLLRSHSPFFEAALSKTWREGKDGRIKLPNDEPALLEVYIQFLYCGQVSVSPVRTAAALRYKEHESEYFTLAELYTLGERLMDIKFKNEVINDMFFRVYPLPSSIEPQRPVASAVDMIYRGTTAGSPARRLMVDIYFWKGKAEWMLGRPEDNNTEFLTDLTALLLRRTDRRSKRVIGDGDSDPFDEALRCEDYHENEAEQPATSKKRKANTSI